MANSNGWGDGSVNNSIGWGKGTVNNSIGWGSSQLTSWSGATDIDGGSAPINTVAPVISGGTSLGSVLSSTTGTWTGTPVITYAYQWRRNGVNIIGATNSTYTIAVADSAASITCQVTATNPIGSSSATSNAIIAQTFSAPVNTVAPAITGTAQQGQTLTSSTGTWTGSPTPTYTYQWKRNGNNITSATNSTYTLVTADVGQIILCTVTATNVVGSSTANSNSVTPTGSTDSDAQAFITAASITDPTQQAAINNLVTGLKTDGIWTKMRAIYPFVGGTASQHKFNLKDPRDLDAAFRILFSGGWTHSSNGIQGGGVNNIANTYFIPSTQFSASPFSVHFSAYSRTSVPLLPERINNDISPLTGSILYDDNTQGDGIIYKTAVIHEDNSGNEYIYAPLSGPSDTQGLFTVSRLNNSSLSLYKNSNTLANNTYTVPNLLPTSSIRVGSFSSKQYAFATIGTGLTSTDTTNLYTRVQAFNTALSRQV